MPKLASPASGRSRLTIVLRNSGDLITVEAVARALGIQHNKAARLLARWTEQSWLRRVRRGLYAPVPLTSASDEQVLDDPWTIVPLLFEPGYVGGASAAQHWDLTEQVFRSVFVFTARHVRGREQTIQGSPFVVTHLAHDKIFGTRALWRGKTRIQVSDPARTIIDMLNAPATGGGIRHVSECLKAYFARGDASAETLIEYAERLGNGAVFKRLGFLTERLDGPISLVMACAARLTQGAVKLDPALPSPKFLRQWRLRLPERWKAEAHGP